MGVMVVVVVVGLQQGGGWRWRGCWDSLQGRSTLRCAVQALVAEAGAWQTGPIRLAWHCVN